MRHRPLIALPNPPRRRWLAAALIAGTGAGAGPAIASGVDPVDAETEVWVDLSEPVPAGARDAAEAARRRARVTSQQDAVAAELLRLGGVELTRVRHARNAIAVRISAARLEAVRHIPGVLRVRPARSLHPPKPVANRGI